MSEVKPVPVAATLDEAAADPALTLDVARELLRDAAAGIRSLAASAEARVAELEAYLRELRADARRYRFLRENCVSWAEDTDEPQLVHRDGQPDMALSRADWRERLDAAIDQQLAKDKASGDLIGDPPHD